MIFIGPQEVTNCDEIISLRYIRMTSIFRNCKRNWTSNQRLDDWFEIATTPNGDVKDILLLDNNKLEGI
jgi:hypothetical protein